jgi:photosystem II stability/assembly factor-like uncharacterized protein
LIIEGILKSRYMKCVAIVLLLSIAIPARISAQDAVSNINLNGVPGPYRFENYCAPTAREIWTAMGGGQVGYDSFDEPSKTFYLADGALYNGDLFGVYFNNAGVGWVVGNIGVIFHTNNNGSNWVLQESGVKEVTLRAITCVDDKHCWVVGGEGTVLRTEDGGNIWQKSEAKTDSDLMAVEFVNRSTGWIVGDGGLILHTNNGGLTWDKQRICIASDGNCKEGKAFDLRSVKFMNEKLGWAAGFDGIARTINGGRRWEVTDLESGREVRSFAGLVSHDGKKVWAVNYGDNFCSDNAGKTWRKCPAEKSTGQN